VNTAFHTYGIIWSPDEIQFFVDDPSKPFFTTTPASLPPGDLWPFNQPIFILLNEAIAEPSVDRSPTSPTLGR